MQRNQPSGTAPTQRTRNRYRSLQSRFYSILKDLAKRISQLRLP